MSVPSETKRVFLSERPKGHISETTFKNETAKLPTPSADQVVVRVDYVSLDPAMRGWLNDTRYAFGYNNILWSILNELSIGRMYLPYRLARQCVQEVSEP